LAMVGMLIQAWIPLQHDIFDVLQDLNDVSSKIQHLTDVSVQTIIHLSFACVFFIASLMHGSALVMGRARSNPLGLHTKAKIAYLIGAFFFLCILSQVMGELDVLHSYKLFDIASVCQRIGVICILLFLADYSRDISKIYRDSQSPLAPQ